MPRVRLIVNPSARSGRGCHRLARLLPEAETVESRSADQFGELVRAAQDDDLDTLAVAGGDGTVALALNALDAVNRVPLAVLPTGSGNDFAKDLGIAGLADALRSLHHGLPRRVDTARACWNGHHRRYCCVASVGLDAHALDIIHHSRWPRSKALNVYAALRALWSYPPHAVRATWDGGCFEGEMMFAAVTNTRGYGGGFLVSPTARLDDGLLDLCIVRRTGRLRLLTQFPRILRGTHGTMPEVVQARSPWVRIEGIGGELAAALDGELPEATTPLDLTCERQSVCVRAPGAKPQTVPAGLELKHESWTPTT
jgi:diacylglycerol kinase (ATP)